MLKLTDPLSGIGAVTNAWASNSATKSFFGMTLVQYREAVRPVYDVRGEIAEMEKKLKGLLARRRDADAAALQLTKKVVQAVKGDPSEGEDSPLYAAMGYTRESERSRGAKRAKAASSASAAQAAAASQPPASAQPVAPTKEGTDT